jgi:hypothetical protein
MNDECCLKKWSSELNGYIDYIIIVSFVTIFCQFKGATISTKEFFGKNFINHYLS